MYKLVKMNIVKLASNVFMNNEIIYYTILNYNVIILVKNIIKFPPNKSDIKEQT